MDESPVSGGFAVVSPGSKLSINAVEGYALEDFSAEAVRSQIAEAQKIAGGSGSERDVAEARIELEVSQGYPHFLVDAGTSITNRVTRCWRACKLH